MERADTATQLRRRGELPIHAAVGLDRMRRWQVLDLMARKLRDSGSSLRVRLACVSGSLALSASDPAFTRDATRTLLEALEKSSSQGDYLAVAANLNTLAGRLGKGPETTALARALREAAFRAPFPAIRDDFLDTLLGLSDRLGEAEVRATADKILDRLLTAGGQPLVRANLTRSQLAARFPVVAAHLDDTWRAAAARRLLGQLSQEQTAFDRAQLTIAFRAVGGKLARDDPQARRLARGVARRVRKEMARTAVMVPFLLGSLAGTLEAVADWLSPAEVTATADALLDGMAVPNISGGQPGLALAFKSIAPRVGDTEVPRLARRLLDRLTPPTPDRTLEVLADVYRVLAVKLSTADLRAAAGRLTESMKRSSKVGRLTAHNLYAATLRAVFAALSAKDVQALVEEALNGLAQAGERSARFTLETVIAAGAARLGPAEARAVAGRLLDRLDRAKATEDVGGLAGVLTVVLKQPGAADARTTVTRLLDRIDRADNAVLGSLGTPLAVVAPGLDSKAAGTAVPRLLARMDRPGYPWPSVTLAAAFRAVAGRLGDADARSTAVQLLDRLGRATRADVLVALVGDLKVLERVLTKVQVVAVARRLVGAMSRTTDWADVKMEGEALEQLIDQLDESERSALARQVVSLLGKNADTFTTFPFLLATLRRLAPRWGDDDGLRRAGVTAARRLLESAGRAADNPAGLPFLTAGLDALKPVRGAKEVRAPAAVAVRRLLDNLSRSGADRFVLDRVRAVKAAAAFVDTRSRATSLEATRRLVTDSLVRADPTTDLRDLYKAWEEALEGLGAQELVDLLKQATCVGEARQVILRRLGDHFHRHFADLWELVEWLELHEPGIDLATPPRVPEPAE